MMRRQDGRWCASTVTVIVEGEVFAHVARGLVFDGRSLTLVDLAPSTLWTSPAPTAGLGYLPTGAFLDLWAKRATTPGRGAPQVRGVLSLLDPDALLQAAWRSYPPHRVVIPLADTNRPALAELTPIVDGKTPVDGKSAAYLCRRGTCEAPVTSPSALTQ